MVSEVVVPSERSKTLSAVVPTRTPSSSLHCGDIRHQHSPASCGSSKSTTPRPLSPNPLRAGPPPVIDSPPVTLHVSHSHPMKNPKRMESALGWIRDPGVMVK